MTSKIDPDNRGYKPPTNETPLEATQRLLGENESWMVGPPVPSQFIVTVDPGYAKPLPPGVYQAQIIPPVRPDPTEDDSGGSVPLEIVSSTYEFKPQWFVLGPGYVPLDRSKYDILREYRLRALIWISDRVDDCEFLNFLGVKMTTEGFSLDVCFDTNRTQDWVLFRNELAKDLNTFPNMGTCLCPCGCRADLAVSTCFRQRLREASGVGFALVTPAVRIRDAAHPDHQGHGVLGWESTPWGQLQNIGGANTQEQKFALKTDLDMSVAMVMACGCGSFLPLKIRDAASLEQEVRIVKTGDGQEGRSGSSCGPVAALMRQEMREFMKAEMTKKLEQVSWEPGDDPKNKVSIRAYILNQNIGYATMHDIGTDDWCQRAREYLSFALAAVYDDPERESLIKRLKNPPALTSRGKLVEDVHKYLLSRGKTLDDIERFANGF